jgi:hypothetical protein
LPEMLHCWKMKGKSRYYAMSSIIKKQKRHEWVFLSIELHVVIYLVRIFWMELTFRSDANNYANEWGPSVNDRTILMEFTVTILLKERLYNWVCAKWTAN